MLARIILCTILAAAIVGGVAWYTGRLPQIIEQPAPSQEVRVKPEPVRTNPTRRDDNPVAKSLDRQVALAAPELGHDPVELTRATTASGSRSRCTGRS